MTDDYTQARLQRIEDRVASLDDTVSIIAAMDGDAAQERFALMFDGDASMAIVYRSVVKGITQEATARELGARGLPRSNQAEVSRALAKLADKNFIAKTPKGYTVRPGWAQFGIDKYVRKVLKSASVSDLV